MSCDGVTTGLPSLKVQCMLSSIRIRASAWASSESSTWMAIWSPSKSALWSSQTSGCKRRAFHQSRQARRLGYPNGEGSVRGSKKHWCSMITSSEYPDTLISRSTKRLASGILPISRRRFHMTNGLKSSIAISWHTTLVHQSWTNGDNGTSWNQPFTEQVWRKRLISL